MDKNKSATKTTVIIVLLVVIIGLLIAIVVLVLNNQYTQAQLDAAIQENTDTAVTDTTDTGTSPSEGTGSESDTGTDVVELSIQEFISESGVTVRLDDWTASKSLSSPVTITGEIPGNWSFEGSFPVLLVNWDGLIIAEQPATLQGDWMTDEYVPFTVTLSFDVPSTYKNGSLILRKDNPSGLSENDDAVEIPVTFE